MKTETARRGTALPLSQEKDFAMLQGKKIILGITGSIAAYKAAYLTRALIKKGAEVQIVITPAGKEFITPVTLSALTGKPVISEFFSAMSIWACGPTSC